MEMGEKISLQIKPKTTQFLPQRHLQHGTYESCISFLFSFSLILLVPKWDRKLPGSHNTHLFTLTSNHCEVHKERGGRKWRQGRDKGKWENLIDLRNSLLNGEVKTLPFHG